MLTWLDILVIVVYLAGMVALGIACRGKQDNTEDYFTAHGGFSKTLGAVLVGLSIAATFFSGISFIAYPSIVLKTGVAISLGMIMLPVSGLIVGYWFLPRYLARGGREPYQIIEQHFGYPTRAVAAGMFVLLRVCWMGTLIYAPTVAVMAGMQLAPGWFWPIVLTIGISSTLYTTLGGIRGVIVTDAIQLVIIALGILWPLGYVLTHLSVPMDQAVSYLSDTGRLHWVNTSFSLREPMTVWGILISAIVGNTAMYIGDQMSLQRYLTSESISQARRAFAINIVGVIVVLVLLVLVGLAMAVWYGTTPGAMPPERSDDAFPRFVASQLPPGASGLIFAAILAATMSSMTSGTNALAGTITLDFFQRLFPDSKMNRLAFAQAMTLVVGLIATLAAGLVSKLGAVFDITQIVGGMFAGPLLACVVLSLLRLRVHPSMMILGMLAGPCAGGLAVYFKLYSLWVGPTTALVSFAVPLIAFVILPTRERAAGIDARDRAASGNQSASTDAE